MQRGTESDGVLVLPCKAAWAAVSVTGWCGVVVVGGMQL